jgi:hypothetical protein
MTLRVALLAPIAWRVPPRQYGPWEQFASLLTEGPGQARRRRHVVRHRRLRHDRSPRWYGADRLLRGCGTACEGLGGAAHLGGVRASGRVRPDPQQFRSGGCVHDRRTGGAASRRLPRRIPLVLLRLRPGAGKEPALRSRSPRAHVRTLANRRLAENQRSQPSQRSSAPNGAPSDSQTRGSTSTGTNSFSTRTRSCPASTAGIGSSRKLSRRCPV